MIEGILIGVVSGLFATAIVRFWPDIYRFLTSRRGTHSGVPVTQCLKMLATDLGYWHKKLKSGIFILRLLPYELSPKLFEELSLGNPRENIDYDKVLRRYKEAIVHIIREGEAGNVGYWDLSVFCRCGDQDVDRVTSHAINSMYFPIEADPLDPDIEHKDAVNTSELGLTDEAIAKGVFLIGHLPQSTKPEKDPLKYIENNMVRWKVGFSFDFDPREQGSFAARWRAVECMRTTAMSAMTTLSELWVEKWKALGTPTAEISNDAGRQSIAIDVDAVSSENVGKWREFIENWFGCDRTESA